jgi:hypothetical protein
LQIDVDVDHYVAVAIILHNLKNLYLVGFEAAAVEVNEVAEKVKQLAFIVAFFWLFFYVFANLLDQVKDLQLVVEHSLIVVIHFLEEVDAPYVFADVLHHFRNVALE